MLELTAENTPDYLRAQGWIGPGPVDVELLSGGVSNAVLRVRTPERLFVLKQSRPQLRTRDAWFSDLNRVYREQEVMEFLHPLMPPGVVPAVLHVDRDNFVFAMSHAPEEAHVWKADLLDDQIDPVLGEQAGLILGRMHEVTANDASFAERFRDQTVFVQLRADPFYRRVQERRPELASLIEPILQKLLTVKEAICHADYTPKNLLAFKQGFTLVDYETAHFGDPTMDLGLFLSHLLLKSVRRPEERARFFDLTRAFWRGYEQAVHFQPLAVLQARGIEHLAVCLLARVDGTSPVDYLPEEGKQETVRRLARWLLEQRPGGWEKVLANVEGA
ncbi:MAG: aminoglycoside phosphotransferase family protein [Gemmataceae bacterium]|nr:aminoglycoside phosphotransferase family protein [Gemmataceae bacterium]